jgi:hypothetical protein
VLSALTVTGFKLYFAEFVSQLHKQGKDAYSYLQELYKKYVIENYRLNLPSGANNLLSG